MKDQVNEKIADIKEDYNMILKVLKMMNRSSQNTKSSHSRSSARSEWLFHHVFSALK